MEGQTFSILGADWTIVTVTYDDADQVFILTPVEAYQKDLYYQNKKALQLQNNYKKKLETIKYSGEAKLLPLSMHNKPSCTCSRCPMIFKVPDMISLYFNYFPDPILVFALIEKIRKIDPTLTHLKVLFFSSKLIF